MVKIRVARNVGVLSIVLLAVGGCRAGNNVPRDDFERAAADFFLVLADTVCTLYECGDLVIHPMLGNEYYSLAQTEGRVWETVGRLHVDDQTVTRPSGLRIEFRAFGAEHLSQYNSALAGWVLRRDSPDDVELLIEFLVSLDEAWGYMTVAVARGQRVNSRWVFELDHFMVL